MIIFLPCFDTCIDGLDVSCENHKQTLLFFNELANEREENKPIFKACCSPQYQNEVIEIIIKTYEEEWSKLDKEEIEKRLETINKVFSSIELAGEHLFGQVGLELDVSLFELALYLNDEYEILIVTNNKLKVNEIKQKWLQFRKDKLPTKQDFIIIDTSQAFWMARSCRKSRIN